jgi:hypothetical protein
MNYKSKNCWDSKENKPIFCEKHKKQIKNNITN